MRDQDDKALGVMLTANCIDPEALKHALQDDKLSVI